MKQIYHMETVGVDLHISKWILDFDKYISRSIFGSDIYVWWLVKFQVSSTHTYCNYIVVYDVPKSKKNIGFGTP